MLRRSTRCSVIWRPPGPHLGAYRHALDDGRKEDCKAATWMYEPIPMDPKPIRKEPQNPFYGKRRIWNVIPSAAGVVARKVDEWGYPKRDPPPTGIRMSQEYYPHFLEKYFPDITCKLVLDSVLNNETVAPQFLFPPHCSREEIHNYLRNIYGFENVVRITVRNVAGKRWKNELGFIRQEDPVKIATVILDSPVNIEFKQVKGTEDGQS